MLYGLHGHAASSVLEGSSHGGTQGLLTTDGIVVIVIIEPASESCRALLARELQGLVSSLARLAESRIDVLESLRCSLFAEVSN